ncbi:MAG TPA: rhomboid family intramembrane serine protease [Myxococcota bacterium]
MRFGPGFTPDVIKWLIGANIAVFLVQSFGPASVTTALWMDERFWNGQLWRAATYMWLHGGGFHLLFNMLGLWMFGSEVAAVWGPRRFLQYYLATGVGAGVVIALWQATLQLLLGQAGGATVGASGALYGVLLASSLLWPDRTVMLLFPPIPLRAIYMIPAFLLMDLIFMSRQVSVIGHLGGALVGLALLARSGDAGITISQLQHRFRRWRMRNKLRALDDEDRKRRQFH